jgi:hypothetical protein
MTKVRSGWPLAVLSGNAYIAEPLRPSAHQSLMGLTWTLLRAGLNRLNPATAIAAVHES